VSTKYSALSTPEGAGQGSHNTGDSHYGTYTGYFKLQNSQVMERIQGGGSMELGIQVIICYRNSGIGGRVNGAENAGGHTNISSKVAGAACGLSRSKAG